MGTDEEGGGIFLEAEGEDFASTTGGIVDKNKDREGRGNVEGLFIGAVVLLGEFNALEGEEIDAGCAEEAGDLFGSLKVIRVFEIAKVDDEAGEFLLFPCSPREGEVVSEVGLEGG